MPALSDDAGMDLERGARGDHDPATCRFCLDTGSADSMIAPCLCAGTSKFVHRACLDEWRAQEADPWQTTHPDGDDLVEIMAKDLQARMEAAPGGGSRFGALSVVLGDMGFVWQMYTPPYIILLIRTFLTLEGIAGQVDPNFNIYEVALPWAVQRALSPSTISARETLRQSLLTGDNKFQWERVDMLIEQQQAEEAEAKEKAEQATTHGWQHESQHVLVRGRVRGRGRGRGRSRGRGEGRE